MTPRQRDRVRTLVADAPAPIDAQTVAAALGVHVTTARFHLSNLVDEGAAVWIVLPSDGVGRPRVGYRIVVPPPIDDLLFMLIARVAPTPSEREVLAADVGRAWAAKHLPADIAHDDGPADPVVLAETILTRLGFKITGVLSTFGDHEISLCGCPLQDLEHELPEVASGVVRGILEEALRSGGQTLESAYSVSVVTDASQGACELRLSVTRVASATGG